MRVSAVASAMRTTGALACLLALAPAAFAQDVRITAPTPSTGAADEAIKPLTPEESDVLRRALMFDPINLASRRTKTLRIPSFDKPANLSVNRNDKPDGSSTVAVKQPLRPDLATAEVTADVGADVNLAAPPPAVYQPGQPLPGTAANDPGSSAAWASVSMANLASVNARVDPTNDQGKLGGTLKHSLPIGKDFSVTIEDGYSVTDTLSASTAPSSYATAAPPITAPQGSTQIWGNEKSVKFDLKPTGTTFGAGLTTASNDPVTHNTLSADQKIYGPLHVTTAVSNLGEASENKSVTAGFKLNW